MSLRTEWMDGPVYQEKTTRRWVAILERGTDESGKRHRKKFYGSRNSSSPCADAKQRRLRFLTTYLVKPDDGDLADLTSSALARDGDEGYVIEKSWHKQSVVYFVRNVESGLIKIGSTMDIRNRLMSLRTANHAFLQLLRCVPGGPRLERDYHETFKHLRVAGEWFRIDPTLAHLALRTSYGASPQRVPLPSSPTVASEMPTDGEVFS